jgi:hypothetical protein
VADTAANIDALTNMPFSEVASVATGGNTFGLPNTTPKEVVDDCANSFQNLGKMTPNEIALVSLKNLGIGAR